MLNELLPTSTGDQANQVVLDKESFLADHHDLLQRFGMDLFPMLVQVSSPIYKVEISVFCPFSSFTIHVSPIGQVVNSGANIYVCYGCLSVINKLVVLSKPDMLGELLKTANIPR